MAKEDIRRKKALRKEARINIRLVPEELESLKEAAESEGISYQTLVASILHKYLRGTLIDLKNAERRNDEKTYEHRTLPLTLSLDDYMCLYI